MSQAHSHPAPQKLTLTHWLILTIASIGFAFDIYELLMLPLVLRPALDQLVGARPGTEAFSFWLGIMFYVPAFAGGLFGLLGGYLTDRLGRRRVLTWSILIYAVSAFLAGFSTNIYWLLLFRSTTFIGVCVEFVAAVAWLAELFPNPEQRERMLGYTQAFSSIGGLLVAVANGICISLYANNMLPALSLPEWASFLGEISQADQAWRYTLMSGLIPAIPLVIIRPFLPESPAWAEKKAAGTLKRPSFAAIFSPQLRRTTIVTMIMFACSYGAAFGGLQMIPQIVPGLTDVQQTVAKMDSPEAKLKREAGEPVKLSPKQKSKQQEIASEYVKIQEIGGLIGRFLLAFLTVRILSRRRLLRVFQFPGLFIMPLVFYFFLSIDNQTYFEIDLHQIHLGVLPFTTVSLLVMICGLVTVAQFSFWGNYLPRVYPVHLRGTGESFAANIGGRMIGTSFAAVTGFLASVIADNLSGPNKAPLSFAYAAAGVTFFLYLVGFICSFFLPEPSSEELPE